MGALAAAGWVQEAQHYLKLGDNIQCKLCPNECLLEPEDRVTAGIVSIRTESFIRWLMPIRVRSISIH